MSPIRLGNLIMSLKGSFPQSVRNASHPMTIGTRRNRYAPRPKSFIFRNMSEIRLQRMQCRVYSLEWKLSSASNSKHWAANSGCLSLIQSSIWGKDLTIWLSLKIIRVLELLMDPNYNHTSTLVPPDQYFTNSPSCLQFFFHGYHHVLCLIHR